MDPARVRAVLVLLLCVAPGALAHGFAPASGSAVASCPLVVASDAVLGMIVECSGAASFPTTPSDGSYHATVAWEERLGWSIANVCLATLVAGPIPEVVARNCFKNGSPVTLSLPASAAENAVEVSLHMVEPEASLLYARAFEEQPFEYTLWHEHI